jgi:hypothetical protein
LRFSNLSGICAAMLKFGVSTAITAIAKALPGHFIEARLFEVRSRTILRDRHAICQTTSGESINPGGERLPIDKLNHATYLPLTFFCSVEDSRVNLKFAPRPETSYDVFPLTKSNVELKGFGLGYAPPPSLNRPPFEVVVRKPG